MPYQKLDEKSLAAAMAMLAFVMWIVGVIWHGLLGQPSLMPLLYKWFSFSNPVHAGMLLVVWAVSFYVFGWLVAGFYNWNLRRK